MAVKQPAAYSPGSSRVERGLFGQTSKACRGEGKNEAVREAGAGGSCPLHRHAFVPGAPWASGTLSLPGRVGGAAATPRRAGQRAAALALSVRGLVDESQILAGVIQSRGRGRGGRLGLLGGRRGRGLAGGPR